ncbi:hypothetical protein M407DRAFT_8663 [Tulasnella calospora MUT 4182]|uniref:BAH domain-containing protein n=1 Tax=Tulasnella calospora MUT 4182 TaxID=1051891 RepID=A0A0C3QH06_9AGAM|nr:hypothetical protein M407DRAFT_8663 [Tulasnella calospora MUT 4182]
MKPRDKAGDEIVRKTEAALPRWKGPSLEGWMNLEGQAARDPYKVYNDIINRLKTVKDKGADTLASDAFTRISEAAVLSELSFTTPMSLALIENRVALRGYPAPKDFDMDMARLFEKGRRWFEEGSKDYGRILILQRLYQGLTSSTAAAAALARNSNQNFASIPAGPGFAKPLHSAGSTSQDAVTTYRIQNKDRTFTDEITFKGMTYKSGDYVHLMNPNDSSRPIIGQIFKLWIPDGGAPGERGIAVCWYFRPEQTFHPPHRPFWEHEVFKTGHFADHAMEDIIEKVGCQFMTRHIRGRPKPPMWYPNWPLYVCDSRYNDRDRVFVRIKNWNSCIPDELRKADFMPILPYERTVMPRKVDSPFLHGVKGPGGLMEEDELRRKSKRAAERTAKSSALPALDVTSSAETGVKTEVAPIVGAATTEVKPPADRSLTVAAGGRAALGAERETRPEAIDALERRKLELNIEIHALEREKDAASKERLIAAKKTLENVNEQLRPLEAAYNSERKTSEQINDVKKRIDALRAKADEAERRYDIASASDIRYYAIPELQKKLDELEAQKTREDASGDKMVADSVTPEAIAEVVARWTGIPVSRLMSSEAQKLLKMEKHLAKQVVGQPEAVKAVANAIRLSRSGLANATRPIASFLFAGPSGTGKTLLSKTLATVLFDSPEAMIRIDASEYSEKHAISRLIGAPPGYIGHDQGGQLTDYVRRKPFCIVLIDEIEKASREFVTLFLQVLDDGRLTDGQGRVVDFRNCVIIMTSNLGASYLNDAAEKNPGGAIPEETRELVMNSIRRHFVPEFINRIDDIIIFRTLSQDNVTSIVDIRLKEIAQRLAARKITLDLDKDAKHYLASVGYSSVYGARPLNRAIQHELLNPLSLYLLEERIRDGETCRVTFDGPHNRLRLHPNHRAKAFKTEAMDLDDDDDEEEWEMQEGERM